MSEQNEDIEQKGFEDRRAGSKLDLKEKARQGAGHQCLEVGCPWDWREWKCSRGGCQFHLFEFLDTSCCDQLRQD